VIPETLERYVVLVTLIKISEFFAEQLIPRIKGKADCSRKDRTERKSLSQLNYLFFILKLSIFY
jgi:hypothetical protein